MSKYIQIYTSNGLFIRYVKLATGVAHPHHQPLHLRLQVKEKKRSDLDAPETHIGPKGTLF
jgi:hypothetical protein